MTQMYLRGAGVTCALGLNVDWLASSLRSGIDAFRLTMCEGALGEDLQAAPIVGYAEGIGGLERYQALAAPALAACLADLSPAERRRCALLLGLPSPGRSGIPRGLAAALRSRLADSLGLAEQRVLPFPHGRVSAFAALEQARALLADGDCVGCVVGGVDVLCNGDSLRSLSAQGVLKEQFDGYIAGEAAAFVLLRSSQGPGPWRAHSSRVSGWATAREVATGTADDPVTGRALVECVRAAMNQSALPETAIRLHINDVSGARIDFEDSAMALTRFFRVPEHEYETWHVASFLGETGAAAGALQLVFAQAALELGFGDSDAVLLTASEGAMRAAAVVESMAPADRRCRRRISEEVMRRHDVDPALALPVPADPGLSLGEPGLHSRLAAIHARELAWLWEMRSAHLRDEGYRWQQIGSYERRLLSHLDALAWSGAEGLKVLASAWEADDPGQFAAALSVLLALPIDSARCQTVVAKAAASPAHQQILAAVMPHVPREGLQPLFDACLRHGSSEVAVIALQAAAKAGARERSAVLRAVAGRDERLAMATLQSAAELGLVELVPDVLAALSRHRASRLGATQLVAMLALGLSEDDVPELAARRMVTASPVAAALQCLRDGTSFADIAGDPAASIGAIEACGWAGEVTLIPALIETLWSTEPRRAEAASRSLHRISGIDVATRDSASSVATPAPAAPEGMSVDPTSWRAALREAGVPVAGSARLRHGKTWHAGSALEHLGRPECSYLERLTAAWEHAVVHRRGLPLHPDQFVAVQRAVLGAKE